MFSLVDFGWFHFYSQDFYFRWINYINMRQYITQLAKLSTHPKLDSIHPLVAPIYWLCATLNYQLCGSGHICMRQTTRLPSWPFHVRGSVCVRCLLYNMCGIVDGHQMYHVTRRSGLGMGARDANVRHVEQQRWWPSLSESDCNGRWGQRCIVKGSRGESYTTRRMGEWTCVWVVVVCASHALATLMWKRTPKRGWVYVVCVGGSAHEASLW